MAVTLKIKRSATTAVPAPGALEVGELAYSEVSTAGTGTGNLFYKTTTGSVIKIGGNVDVTKLSQIESEATGDQIASETYFDFADPDNSQVHSPLSSLQTSELSATHVEGAIVELEGRLKVVETDISDNSDIEDLVGSMFTSNTETGIVTAYDNVNRKITLDVNDPVITVTGSVSGFATMTDLGDVTINVTPVADAVTLGTDTTGQYASTVATSGLGLSTDTPAADDGTAYTIASNATTDATPDTIVYRTATGGVNAVDVNATTLDTTGDAVIGGNTTIAGDLLVQGNTVTVETTQMSVQDPLITLGDGTTTDDNKDRGVEFIWHDGVDVKTGFFGFDDSTGKFTFIPDGTNTGETFSGTVGDIDANLSGNAGTATKLETSRNISLSGDVVGTTSFDGSSDVTIATTVQPDSVALGTDTTGQYASTVTTTGSGISINTSNVDDGTAYIINSNATATNNPETIVLRDAAGNFTANVITATLSGNASTATSLQTGRTIGIGTSTTPDPAVDDYGVITLISAPTFDGSSNVVIDAKVADDARYMHLYQNKAEVVTGVKTFTAVVEMQAGADGLDGLGNKTSLDNFVIDGGTF